ncbi:MAG: helix-turn-helix transcriptional regulator [Planctomycetes bacterium]|nr:helix-turn-helix transcriptional regulator [Planctomycetota bacterium]
MYFGEWLAKRRADLGLTIRDIAEVVDVNPVKVSAWERGMEDPPYEVRDACWDALKRDGELPPLDPPPCMASDFRPPEAARRKSAPRTWLEEWAEKKGTTLDEVLKAFGLSATLKYQWRNGKIPSSGTAWKITTFLGIPNDVAKANGWNPGENN